MKITKSNYNELRTQELDNNYAKVWHVNEIREELLANTGGGGVTTITVGNNVVEGNVVFQNSNSANITVTTDLQNNAINFNYTVPYQEVIFTVEADAETVRPIYSSVEGLEYTNLLSGSTTILTPNLAFTCDAISVQLTVTKELGLITNYVEVPYVVNTNPATGEVRVSVDHSSTGTNFEAKGIKSGLYVNLKFFNFALTPQL